MWLFGKGSRLSTEELGWKTLENEGDLTNAIKQSENNLVAIFKHSTSCSISAMAKSRLSKFELDNHNGIDFYYLDLLRHRSLSNQIANQLNVQHESPQLILLKNGEVIEAVSHGAVRESVISRHLTEI